MLKPCRCAIADVKSKNTVYCAVYYPALVVSVYTCSAMEAAVPGCQMSHLGW